MRTTRAVVECRARSGLSCIAGTASAADQIPDVKGKSVGKTHSIVAGAPHIGRRTAKFEELGLLRTW